MGKHRARLALTTPCASARDLSSLSSVAGFTMSPTLISLASFGLCLGLRIRVEAAPQDHTTGNLIRLSLAGLLLLVLGVLLAEAWHSRRKHREAAQ
uniref:Leukocyte immunoglobulin-like receptor subfamily A member 2 n=1 Tax=Phascolarctos cinereus TaxID=38626 RepID=A0A6P5LUV5_PHACI|nr:leukocyte immunoglobulin-like receptor subfamily A member 2 [Phascolarctos cinereus]